jgi:hypothetical protein
MAGMSLPADLTITALLAVSDPVERAWVLAQRAHDGQVDKSGNAYFDGHLLDVHHRAAAYGAGADEQAAALLHDVVEDTDVTEQDLLEAGFSDVTLLIVDLMTKREGEPNAVYYARLRAFEPARRLKLDADVASNGDPDRLALVTPVSTRERLTAKYANARAALAV